MNTFIKPTVVALLGLGSAILEITAPMFILTGAFVFADAFTAWRLQKRLELAGKLKEGKARFSSARFARVFVTLSKILGVLILTAMADHLILAPLGIPAVKIVAGAICFWQAVSLLENEAAQNNAPWAVHARRFLIDKATRYLKS